MNNPELTNLIYILKTQCVGKENAKKNTYLQNELRRIMNELHNKEGKRYYRSLNGKTIRRLIGQIREEVLITGLCADPNKGYWIAQSKEEIIESGMSLIRRAKIVEKRGKALLLQAEML